MMGRVDGANEVAIGTKVRARIASEGGEPIVLFDRV
jgi:hypothetical protein